VQDHFHLRPFIIINNTNISLFFQIAMFCICQLDETGTLLDSDCYIARLGETSQTYDKSDFNLTGFSLSFNFLGTLIKQMRSVGANLQLLLHLLICATTASAQLFPVPEPKLPVSSVIFTTPSLSAQSDLADAIP
jgi:hypothetical protein